MADRIRAQHDIAAWPDLKHFNSEPCPRHAPDLASPVLCARCGLKLRRHQRVGSMWMFAGLPGMLGDTVGPQPLDAKVLTPGGWARMGDLEAGDEVIDPDGSSSQVAEVIPQGTQDVYKITFSDGTSAESTLGHLWEVRGMTGDRLRYKTRVGRELRDVSPWKVRTLGEIRNLKGNYAVSLIRKAPDLGVDDKTLPVDPYLVGLLLGDGSLSKNTPEFGSADQELLTAAKELLPDGWGWTFAMFRTGCEWYRLNGSQPVLRQLGMFGKRAWEKSVPEQYKWASAEARLALLQGLLDTDGNWSAGSGAEFSSASRQLAEDVADLGRSLGLRTSQVRARKTSYVYKGEKRQGRDAYRVIVAPAPGRILFRLPRKIKSAPRQRTSGDLTNAGARSHWQRDQRVKWIRSIEYARTVPVQCIRVTAPSHLYVTDDWTVTHNSGKTAQVLAMLAMCKESGELSLSNRAVIVCKAPTVHDPWGNEIRRLLKGIPYYIADGTAEQRTRGYMGTWEVAVVSVSTLAGSKGRRTSRDGDVAILADLPVGMLFYDDLDPLRNPKTQASKAVNLLARQCSRVNGAHATPLQKGKLAELHSMLEPCGATERLGSIERVKSRYVISESKWVRVRDPRDRTGRTTKMKQVFLDNGITSDQRLLRELRAKIRPMVLRRTAADLDGDFEIPEVSYVPTFIDLSPRQRERYNELRKGSLRRLRESGEEVRPITKAEAAIAFLRGAQICSGLAALDDGRDDSAKLDWVMSLLTGPLGGGLDEAPQKAVVFIQFKPNIAALSRRLKDAGIGHVLIWGEEADKRERQKRLEAFRFDPSVQVLAGTSSIESGLNLQVAGNLIPVDTIPNPARMEQLVGRVRRQGSPFPTVYVPHLLARDTQEEAYLPVLRREAEVADTVWNESTSMFTAYTPRQLLQMVAGQAA
jgi:Helicase conserved C-terminal domain/LAGLIDADG-like domain